MYLFVQISTEANWGNSCSRLEKTMGNLYEISKISMENGYKLLLTKINSVAIGFFFLQKLANKFSIFKYFKFKKIRKKLST